MVARVRSQKRLEKNERTREDLLTAALGVVGEMGYARASIAKIAEAAGLSTGTFYLHFPSKEELYDQLLPWANIRLTEMVPLKLKPGERYMAFEERNIRGFFDYIRMDLGFARVMLEAEVAAPKAWAEYTAVRQVAYMAVMEEAWRNGEFPAYRLDELPQLCTLLVGLRKALVQGQREATATPRKAIATYLLFVGGALSQSVDGTAATKAKRQRTPTPVAPEVSHDVR